AGLTARAEGWVQAARHGGALEGARGPPCPARHLLGDEGGDVSREGRRLVGVELRAHHTTDARSAPHEGDDGRRRGSGGPGSGPRRGRWRRGGRALGGEGEAQGLPAARLLVGDLQELLDPSLGQGGRGRLEALPELREGTPGGEQLLDEAAEGEGPVERARSFVVLLSVLRRRGEVTHVVTG